ncbi:MAG: UvrB/UvrC motif-containing protein [Planctomycetota bacterium]|nr:UvrB/UvrC motif-containing protein [Planctomycetota bacterium]MDA1180114.1 UvrB/UvrC motif-containing protein [Planctomycetota bacterium]
MKCQLCEKPAAFHITELTGEEIQELHLCEDHARQYLSQGEAGKSPTAPALVPIVSTPGSVGHTAEELSRLDQQACPICGITFFEFRNIGRLGCPHDYECFANELEPLIVSIHGETKHVGKTPKRATRRTKVETELIRLRRDMKDAVAGEDYEKASEIRDLIRRLQETKTAEADPKASDPATSDPTASDTTASDPPAT